MLKLNHGTLDPSFRKNPNPKILHAVLCGDILGCDMLHMGPAYKMASRWLSSSCDPVLIFHLAFRCDQAAAGRGGLGWVSPGCCGQDCRWREGGGYCSAQDSLWPYGSPAAWRWTSELIKYILTTKSTLHYCGVIKYFQLYINSQIIVATYIMRNTYTLYKKCAIWEQRPKGYWATFTLPTQMAWI